MSSIIDALKKSDNNRNNESGAQLNAVKFGQQPAAKRRRGFWLLIILLSMVALAVFAWTQGWHHSVIAQAQNWLATEQPATEQTTQLKTQPTNPNKQPSTAQMVTEPATVQTNKLTPPKANEVKAKRLAIEQAQKAADSDKKQTLDVIATRKTDPEAQSAQANSTSKELTAQSKPITSSQTESVDEVSENAKQAAIQNRKDLEPSLKQDYLLVHQIDFEIRKNIPPIKLNIHIFDPDPENRMVILNGIKYATGDLIEELVAVEEINQEGVVLEFEGIRFLIPK